MARTEVSNVIRDILEAFQNGLKFSKGEGKRHRRRHSEPSSSDTDKNSRSSLIKRPQEIKQAYEQSVTKHGRQFEVGDATSQMSLAQILLSFNTGLVKLLNNALSQDSKHRSMSSTSLFDLSESAGVETLNALSELNSRLSASSRLYLPLATVHHNRDSRGKAVARLKDPPPYQATRRPPPTPQLKNGGWVRSKSDPSVISVVVSKRAKSEQRRGSTSQSPSSPRPKIIAMDATTKKQPEYPTDEHFMVQDLPPAIKPKPRHLQATVGLAPIEERPSSAKELVRHPSLYIVPSDFFDMFPRFSEESDKLAPLLPPKVPLHSRPRPHAALDEQDDYCRRARPTSMMTFMTASTKIGEIPEHRLPDRDLSPEEQDHIPMPYVIPAMLNPSKKRAPRTLKFWKKERGGKETVGSVLV